MAGKATLQGDVLRQSLEVLNTVAEECDRAGIRLALDGGTALGVVREQRLLPWDTDMDLAIDWSEVPRFKRLVVRLWCRHGYRIRFRYATRDIGPYRKGDLRVFKIWKRKFFLLKGDVLMEVFVRKQQDGKAHWLLGNDKPLLNAMPEKFHQDLTTIDFNGRQFYVPAATDEFLTYRYGDWRTPVKEWDAFKQDGAIAGRREV